MTGSDYLACLAMGAVLGFVAGIAQIFASLVHGEGLMMGFELGALSFGCGILVFALGGGIAALATAE